MANFNDKINSGTGFVLCDQEHNYFIYQSDSMKEFKRIVEDYLYCRKSAYRLFIQYKDTHRAKSVAGRCFMWNCASATSDSVEVRSLNCDSNEDLSYFGYFGDPVFDFIAGAIFITNRYVYAYGDTWIEAVELEEKHVVCNAYVCSCLVSQFRIPADVFDRCFGLEENFPKQYTKPVKVEKKMSTAIRRIGLAFELIDECFDELRHGQASGRVFGWGDSIRETIDEAIRTYKREVEKMDEKVENLIAQFNNHM